MLSVTVTLKSSPVYQRNRSNQDIYQQLLALQFEELELVLPSSCQTYCLWKFEAAKLVVSLTCFGVNKLYLVILAVLFVLSFRDFFSIELCLVLSRLKVQEFEEFFIISV